GYSIPAQKGRLTAFCVAQGWPNVRFYIDEGVSAKDMNRPKLQLLLDHVKGGQINVLLVYRLDRFTRRVKDLKQMLEFLEAHNCAFKSATEPYDTSTAMGKLFITIVAALAEWETDNLSERIKMALENKVSGGERVGSVPYGFDLTEDEKLIANEEQSAVVIEMIEKAKSGMSSSQIAQHLNKTNDDRVWHPTGVLRVLRNPALYGATRWNDKVYEDTHTGLITRSEYFRLQRMLEDRSIHHNRDVQSIYLFQGKLYCPHCRNVLSVNRYVRTKKDGTQTQGAVYKCQACWKKGNTMLSVGEHRFVDALKEYMKNVKLDEKYIEPPKENNELEKLQKELKKVEKKREKFQRAWAADKMTDEEFDKLMDETRDIYEELKMKIVAFKEPVEVDLEAIKKSVFTFNESFHYLSQEEKRNFISQFIRRIEFNVIPQPPQRPDRAKKGKGLVVLSYVEFY
ncbi:recombinase family protein, partial [Bacillus xiapuensis]|nr:recombinase family protein [Bacillus xiapuensis]